MNGPGRCPLQSPDVPFYYVPFYISVQMIFFLPRGTFKQQPLFFPSNRHLISPSKLKRRKPHAPESAELQGHCQAAPRRRRCLWWPHVTAGGSCRACASPAVTQAGPNLVPAFASAIPAYPYAGDAGLGEGGGDADAGPEPNGCIPGREAAGTAPALLRQRCSPREDAQQQKSA